MCVKFGKWPLIVAEARRGNTLLLPSTVIVEMFGSVLERAIIIPSGLMKQYFKLVWPYCKLRLEGHSPSGSSIRLLQNCYIKLVAQKGKRSNIACY